MGTQSGEVQAILVHRQTATVPFDFQPCEKPGYQLVSSTQICPFSAFPACLFFLSFCLSAPRHGHPPRERQRHQTTTTLLCPLCFPFLALYSSWRRRALR